MWDERNIYLDEWHDLFLANAWGKISIHWSYRDGSHVKFHPKNISKTFQAFQNSHIWSRGHTFQSIIVDPFGWYPPKRIERARAGCCRGRYHTLENPSRQADVVSYSSAISACEEHINFLGAKKKRDTKWRKSGGVFDNMFPQLKKGLVRNNMFKL